MVKLQRGALARPFSNMANILISRIENLEMANFEFDQGEQQFIVQTLNNPNGEAHLPPVTSQSLPPVSQAVGPLPSVGLSLNPPAQNNLDQLSQADINQDTLTVESSVAQQLSNISECDSSLRDRSASPKFIQLTNMATITNASQQGLNIKQESSSPPLNQQLNQVPLQQYAFVPSHNHFVSQQLSPSNVTTSVSPLTSNNNQILPQQQIIHNLAAQICPQVPQQHQQPQQQPQQLMQQQQPQLLHQMQQSQPQQILQQIQAQQLTSQHQQQVQQQSHQLQQQQFQQQFQGQMQEYSQHQLVQIMNNNSALQRTQGSLGQTVQDHMSQTFLPQGLNIGDAISKPHKSRKRSQHDSDDGDTNDSMDDSHSAMPIKKRPHQVPEDLKDDAYWEKRKKNNDSARRSREARRVKEEQVAMRVVYLENENLQLRTEVTILKTEIEKLRGMLYE